MLKPQMRRPCSAASILPLDHLFSDLLRSVSKTEKGIQGLQFSANRREHNVRTCRPRAVQRNRNDVFISPSADAPNKPDAEAIGDGLIDPVSLVERQSGSRREPLVEEETVDHLLSDASVAKLALHARAAHTQDFHSGLFAAIGAPAS